MNSKVTYKSISILFYHSKNSLYHYIILFYNSSTSQNSISIKILFLYNCQFFLDSYFLGFPTIFFLPLLLSQPLATHKPSTTTATAPKTQATDQLKPLINPSTTTATTPKTQATDQPINNHSHDTKNPSH